jgi:hypothetical protein
MQVEPLSIKDLQRFYRTNPNFGEVVRPPCYKYVYRLYLLYVEGLKQFTVHGLRCTVYGEEF